MSINLNDPVSLTQKLIQCESVTPKDGGALDLVQSALEQINFKCERLNFSEEGTEQVSNLYAKIGNKSPNFCFAGHTDVVPTGNINSWTHNPFAGIIKDNYLFKGKKFSCRDMDFFQPHQVNKKKSIYSRIQGIKSIKKVVPKIYDLRIKKISKKNKKEFNKKEFLGAQKRFL